LSGKIGQVVQDNMSGNGVWTTANGSQAVNKFLYSGLNGAATARTTSWIMLGSVREKLVLGKTV